MDIKSGAIRLFKLFGVNVYLHWSWALVAIVQIWLARNNPGAISHKPEGLAFHAALYLCLFLIVLIHEFGHALACKSVGGKAERIILWPLGGVAYVQPPPRAGALLWSIAAGPLVNVILLPITIIPAFMFPGDFLIDLAVMNGVLLVFNMLPFYPLDGGQILRALLWFVTGPAISLIVASIIGLIGAAGLAVLTLVFLKSVYLGFIVMFMGLRCLASLRAGKVLYKLEQAPRWHDAACPHCGQQPPQGPYWRCMCGVPLDTFQNRGVCPNCGQHFAMTACPFCGQAAPMEQWYAMHGFPVQAQPQ